MRVSSRNELPMSDLSSFLRTIKENFFDDTPRLVFADWLEENGQPNRAEFIRVQCELAHTLMSDPRRKVLFHRQSELLRLHHREWWKDWPFLFDDPEFDP